jgi:hypothetical protein
MCASYYARWFDVYLIHSDHNRHTCLTCRENVGLGSSRYIVSFTLARMSYCALC